MYDVALMIMHEERQRRKTVKKGGNTGEGRERKERVENGKNCVSDSRAKRTNQEATKVVFQRKKAVVPGDRRAKDRR